jgi:hypothetical protein
MIDMKALHATKRKERLPRGLIVLLTGTDGKSAEFSFADVASRDEFMTRARRLGKMVEIVRA